MSEDLLKQLGITEKELQSRVVERLCDRVMGTTDDDDEWAMDGNYSRKLRTHVEAEVDKRIKEVAEKYVVPQVAEIVEKLTIYNTNNYGEKRGEPMSFVEYMISRADKFLNESVDSQGNATNAYGAKGTRASYLVDKHLQEVILKTSKDAVQSLNLSIAGVIGETLKCKLVEAAANLQITVKSK